MDTRVFNLVLPSYSNFFFLFERTLVGIYPTNWQSC